MKKAIFFLLVVGFAGLGIYSCQKDTAETLQGITPSTTTADNRVDFADCDECAADCADCCLKLECLSGGCTIYYTNPITGLTNYKAFTSPGVKYVCAGGGWTGISGSGWGRITVCSTNDSYSKVANQPLPYPQKQLSWDCHF